MSGRDGEKLKVCYLYGIAATVVAIDQILKHIVTKNYPLGVSRPLIGNFVHITLWRNRGGAFGILPSMPFIISLISAITIIAVFLIISYYAQLRYGIALSLLLGGTVGNLIDRLRLGYVIDFIDFTIWPIFNIADVAITFGVIILLCQMFLDKHDHPDGTSPPLMENNSVSKY